jgi:hypothetical protein
MRQVILSEHALWQMGERHLSTEVVIQTMQSPDEVITQGERFVAHKLIHEEGKRYLLRVFYEDDGDNLTVVTVYKTSKIAKYRSAQ